MHAGGGVALLYASKELEKLQTANFDQKIGIQIIQNALKVYKILFSIITHFLLEYYAKANFQMYSIQLQATASFGINNL